MGNSNVSTYYILEEMAMELIRVRIDVAEEYEKMELALKLLQDQYASIENRIRKRRDDFCDSIFTYASAKEYFKEQFSDLKALIKTARSRDKIVKAIRKNKERNLQNPLKV